MPVYRVIKNQNYTNMCNHHLQNQELSLKAKGLMSLFLSLPDNWRYSQRGIASICREGVDAIREATKELEKCGYVIRKRLRNEKGHLGDTEYTILEMPLSENPILENPMLDIPMQEKPILDNPTQLNTNKQITKEKNTKGINNSSNLILSADEECGVVDNQDETRKDENRNHQINNYDYWKRQIETNVDYESLRISYPYDNKLIDEFINLMVETVMSNGEYIQIASGKYPHSLVKEKFLGIDYSHMQYIIDCFNEAARMNEIKNIKQYMKALIFNAPTTIDSYYTAKVRYDMPWLGKNHSEE